MASFRIHCDIFQHITLILTCQWNISPPYPALILEYTALDFNCLFCVFGFQNWVTQFFAWVLQFYWWVTHCDCWERRFLVWRLALSSHNLDHSFEFCNWFLFRISTLFLTALFVTGSLAFLTRGFWFNQQSIFRCLLNCPCCACFTLLLASLFDMIDMF